MSNSQPTNQPTGLRPSRRTDDLASLFQQKDKLAPGNGEDQRVNALRKILSNSGIEGNSDDDAVYFVPHHKDPNA